MMSSLICLCFLISTISSKSQGFTGSEEAWKEAYKDSVDKDTEQDFDEEDEPGADYTESDQQNNFGGVHGSAKSASEWIDYLS